MKKNKQNTNDKLSEYNSGELFLDIVRYEYSNELNRNSILDTKSNIALPVLSAYFFLMIQLINIKEILVAKIACLSITAFLFIFFIGAFLSALLSILLLFKTIQVNDYSIINPDDFYDPSILRVTTKEFAATISRYYIMATKHNKTVNDRRVSLYKKAIISSEFSLVLFFLYLLILNISKEVI